MENKTQKNQRFLVSQKSEAFLKINYTKYEKARMVGSRALQLSMGAPFLLKITEEDLEKINFSSIKIALMEFEAGIIPITIKRPLPLN